MCHCEFHFMESHLFSLSLSLCLCGRNLSLAHTTYYDEEKNKIPNTIVLSNQREVPIIRAMLFATHNVFL